MVVVFIYFRQFEGVSIYWSWKWQPRDLLDNFRFAWLVFQFSKFGYEYVYYIDINDMDLWVRNSEYISSFFYMDSVVSTYHI